MAMTSLIVEVTSENQIEEATCRIEGEDFVLSRTSGTSWAGEHKVDVVGLVQYSVGVRADQGAKWNLTIAKSSGGDPFVKRSCVVKKGTTIDTISGSVPLP